MKTVRIAYALLIISLIAVIINSLVLNNLISSTIDAVESASIEDSDTALIQYNKIYDDFKEKEKYISLTVNHEDLTSVELAFAELIGAAEAGDTSSLLTIKNRLRDSLEHLRRLSGINIYSIF